MNIKSLLEYDPVSGDITWSVDRSPKVRRGDLAGWVTEDGYRELKVNGKSIKSHRVAWFLYTGNWPASEIDHVNGNRADNRWSNLREATPLQNACNKNLCKNSKSGYKGVSFCKRNNKWRAYISVNHKMKHLGYWNTAQEAAHKYDAACLDLHGQFARTNFPTTNAA